MTGTHWIQESGFLDGPVMITNTHSVGVVRDAVIAWQVKRGFVPRTSGIRTIPSTRVTNSNFCHSSRSSEPALSIVDPGKRESR
jgi:hypothetical protein